MRRSAVAVVALAVVALCAAGCTSPPDRVSASMTSPPRPAASELAPEDDLSGSIDEFAEQFGEEFGELPGMEEFSEGLDDFESGMDDMFEQFETELGVAGDCLDLLMTYAQLMGSVFGTLPGGSSRDAVTAELRAALPEELHDELQVIVDGVESVERDGLSGAGAMTDPAFLEANDAIVSWLQSACGPEATPGQGS